MEKAQRTPRVKKTVLNGEEVCRIISTCAAAGVEEITIGDLQVRFGTKAKPATKPLPLETVGQEKAEPSSPENENSEQSQKIEQETHEQLEFATREQQLEELQLTDPLEYERQIASGDLTDEERGDEEA